MYSYQVLYKFQVQKDVQKYKVTKKRESSRRRGEFSIYHFVINAELREVQVWENASDLLECQLESVSKGVSTHVHKIGFLSLQFLL